MSIYLKPFPYLEYACVSIQTLKVPSALTLAPFHWSFDLLSVTPGTITDIDTGYVPASVLTGKLVNPL